MDPVAALRRVAYLLERELAPTYRVRAFRRAADRLAGLAPAELARHVQNGTLTSLKDVGPRTAEVAAQAAGGQVPEYLAALEERAGPLAEGGAEVRSWLRGDLHSHSSWSDGGSPVEEMARAAVDLGYDYLAMTDHSPRLTVANGLSRERLTQQLELIAGLNDELAPFRILTGIEVDILEDGSLDQEADVLAALDVVVASVHSKLRQDAAGMTRRMLRAVENPLVDVLGHCTGRLVTGGRGNRPESTFDAAAVFAACAGNDVAVEINSRPERRDPPTRLLRLALGTGCRVSVDSDSHAPGQLEFVDHGCARAAELGIGRDRIVNTMGVEDLLAWTHRGR